MALEGDTLHKIVVENAKDIAQDKAEEIVGKAAIKSAGVAVSIVMAFSEAINEANQELLDTTREDEGCPHIKVLQGSAGAFIDMIGYLSSHEGLAWQNGDGNTQWYYHPDPKFGPTMRTGYLSLPGTIKQISDNGRKDCEICQNIRKARGG